MIREDREFAKSRIEYLLKISSFVFDERDKEALEMAIQALSQEPNRDIKEIAEIIKCDADAETKCKMISNILTAKPHYFEVSQEPTEKPMCDRNICISNEYNGIGCDECIVNKPQEPMREFTEEEAKAYSKTLDKMYKPTGFNVFNEPCDDAISREAAINIASLHCLPIDETVKALERLPSVTQKSDEQLYKNGFADGYEQGHNDAEQKSGVWIKKGKLWECSVCRDLSCCHESYCNNCGAKMESEE